jgi:hypothetical protein
VVIRTTPPQPSQYEREAAMTQCHVGSFATSLVAFR